MPPEFKGLYIRSRLKRWLMAHTLAVPAALKYAPQTLNFVFGPQKWPADYIIEGGGMVGLRPSHFYATATDTVAIEHDLARIEARYGEISMPAGILFGSADRVLDIQARCPCRTRSPGWTWNSGWHRPHAAIRGA